MQLKVSEAYQTCITNALQPQQKRQRKAVSPVRRHSSSATDDPTLAVQREKIKETNRKAQRRYRDRQRVRDLAP